MAGTGGGGGHRTATGGELAQALIVSSEAITISFVLSIGFVLVEFVELGGHPYFVGTQAHPEFRSRPDRPHPLFVGLVAAAVMRSDSRENRIFNIDTLQAGS